MKREFPLGFQFVPGVRPEAKQKLGGPNAGSRLGSANLSWSRFSLASVSVQSHLKYVVVATQSQLSHLNHQLFFCACWIDSQSGADGHLRPVFGQVWQGSGSVGHLVASVWPVSGQLVSACDVASCSFWPENRSKTGSGFFKRKDRKDREGGDRGCGRAPLPDRLKALLRARLRRADGTTCFRISKSAVRSSCVLFFLRGDRSSLFSENRSSHRLEIG
jgi:hypothetical protein